MVVSENAETKKSMVKFSMFPTKPNSDLVNTWLDNSAGNAILLSEGAFTRQFRNMFIINDPEFNFTADGVTEIIFEGSPSL